jgi:hypothetical protein
MNPSGAGIDRAERQTLRPRSVKKLVMEAATKRFGKPPRNVRGQFDALGASKFDKVDWGDVLEVENWKDLLALVKVGTH